MKDLIQVIAQICAINGDEITKQTMVQGLEDNLFELCNEGHDGNTFYPFEKLIDFIVDYCFDNDKKVELVIAVMGHLNAWGCGKEEMNTSLLGMLWAQWRLDKLSKSEDKFGQDLYKNLQKTEGDDLYVISAPFMKKLLNILEPWFDTLVEEEFIDTFELDDTLEDLQKKNNTLAYNIRKIFYDKMSDDRNNHVVYTYENYEGNKDDCDCDEDDDCDCNKYSPDWINDTMFAKFEAGENDGLVDDSDRGTIIKFNVMSSLWHLQKIYFEEFVQYLWYLQNGADYTYDHYTHFIELFNEYDLMNKDGLKILLKAIFENQNDSQSWGWIFNHVFKKNLYKGVVLDVFVEWDKEDEFYIVINNRCAWCGLGVDRIDIDGYEDEDEWRCSR